MQSKRTSLRLSIAVFASSLALCGQTFTTLHTFKPNRLGWLISSGVVVGSDGQIYGTAVQGGAWGWGLVYELQPPASPGGAWTEVVLHSFNSDYGDGHPSSGANLILGPNGGLYGVTEPNSYAQKAGTVFQLLPPPGTGAHWSETVLYAFTGLGSGPYSTLAPGPSHSLYGTTSNYGTVFRIAPPVAPGGPWAETVLHSFYSGAGDGTGPVGALAVAQDGPIYGSTWTGGTSAAGTVYQLSPPVGGGGAWTETLLHSFTGVPDGSTPMAGLVMGSGGVIYGTTSAGGGNTSESCPAGCGTVFQLAPPAVAGGPWTETILHTFSGACGSPAGDGAYPNSDLVLGANGVLYGTTLQGGLTNNGCQPGGNAGVGTIFELKPPSSPGGAWSEAVLYRFTGGADGWKPNGVTIGPDGALYGTTQAHSATDEGTVFSLVLP